MAENKQHLYCLDGLKGIGACIVAFIWHYHHFGLQEGNPFQRVFKISYMAGWSMVDLFFILSGFGMMLGYASRIYNKEIMFKDFILKRLKKLYPLFIFSTILVICLELIIKFKSGGTFIYANFDFYHVVLNLLFLQDGLIGTEYSMNGPGWCITVFLVCYCILFFTVKKVKKFSHVFYVFSILAIIGAALIGTGWQYPIFNDQIGRGIAGFSIGVLIYFVYINREKFKSEKLGYCCLIFLLVAYMVFRFISIDYSGHFTLAMILGLGPMMTISTLFIRWQNFFMGNIILRFLGMVSWEIYLLHFPVQCCVKAVELCLGIQINYGSKLMWGIYVIATIAIASLYHFVLAKGVDRAVLEFFKLRKKAK